MPAAPSDPLDPALADRLARDEFVIDSVESAGGGVMGAKRLQLHFPSDGQLLDVKWKAAPAGGDGWNNSPRREIGAYVAQQLFLDEPDHLVPPIVARAIGVEAYRIVDEKAAPNIDGTQSVLGAAAVWLTGGQMPDTVLDRQRFADDRAYAYHIANLNLLAYLIHHRDARKSNFLLRDPDPRTFMIDNGIAFSGFVFNYFKFNFDKMRVPALPEQSIARLRRVAPADLQRLAVFAELRVDDVGVLRPVELGAPLDPKVGTRVSPGHVQLGLTAAEIDGIAHRLSRLLARVDRGKLILF